MKNVIRSIINPSNTHESLKTSYSIDFSTDYFLTYSTLLTNLLNFTYLLKFIYSLTYNYLLTLLT